MSEPLNASPGVRGSRKPGAGQSRPEVGIARIAFGLTLLGVWLDQWRGLGFTGFAEASFSNGGSPIAHFFPAPDGGSVKSGITWSIFSWTALDANQLFMAVLLTLGLLILAGIGMHAATVSATALLVIRSLLLFTLGHTLGALLSVLAAILLIWLCWSKAGNYWGLGKPWRRLIRNNAILV